MPNTIANIISNMDTNTFKKLYDCINEAPKYTNKDVEEYKMFSSWNVKYEMLQNAISTLNNKYTLNNKSNSEVDALIDIASGRGNDLNRWNSMNIKRVVGVEYDKLQYNEAIQRYKKSRNIKTKVSYINASATDKNLYDLISQSLYKPSVSLVTCNFALNYFIDSTNFFETLVKCLDVGGLFVGTAADGDFINFLFNNFGSEIDSKLYYIKKLNDKEYEFKINTPYFAGNAGNAGNADLDKTKDKDDYETITESFIYKKKFIAIAKHYGLVPYSIKDGVPALFNFVNYPLSYNDKSKTYYKRHIDLATLYFGFSFIKASANLMNKINVPVCLEVDGLESFETTRDNIKKQIYGHSGHKDKNVVPNYIIIKRKNVQLPVQFYEYYPINTILFYEKDGNKCGNKDGNKGDEFSDEFSHKKYSRDPKQWDAISISIDSITELNDKTSEYAFFMNIQSLQNPKNYVIDFY